jgi:cytochrome c553
MTMTILGRACAMNRWVVTTACILLMASGATLASDYEAGQKKAKEVCAACHGEDGNKPLTPETPRLAGQYYDYLEHSLKAYRSGARENPLMSPMAKPLSDKDIKDVAWYFSKQQGLVSKY